MATEIPRIYLDSCVYIELFVGSPGTARFDASAALLRSAIRGELRIVASEMVRVEVAHLGGVPSQGLRSIDEAFDSPALLWIQLDRTIARAARAVVERGVLKPADAIHLCSAAIGKAESLCTWDSRLLSASRDPAAEVPIYRPEDRPGQQSLDVDT
jgi:predicted nucleic acid-binding protein